MKRINHHEDKLHEALSLLNEAAKEKKEEINELISDKYSHIKDALETTADNGKDVVTKTKKRFLRSLQAQEKRFARKVKTMDVKVHKNPWPYLGAAAVSSVIIGIFLGKKNHHNGKNE